MKAAELTERVIEWMKTAYPGSVIVTEMSVEDWGGARLDVAAVTENEIVGVEIKGEGDSPTRLDLQGLVYGKVARSMWLLVTPEGSLFERCMKKKPVGWGVLEVSGDAVRPQNTAKKMSDPFVENGRKVQRLIPDPDSYRPDDPFFTIRQCPWAMCGTLWRDELYEIVRLNNLKVEGRALVGSLTEAICEQLPVTKIHDAMIAQLCKREWRKPVIDLREPKPKQGLLL